MILCIIKDCIAAIVDDQTSFLFGDLEEAIFINTPPGYYES